MPNLIPVGKERHGGKRWRRYTSYAFAAGVNTVPIVGAELPRTATKFPVAFLKHEDRWLLVAVLGFEPQRNVFVADNGQWLGGYVPAAFRAYPFALARAPDGQHVLCVDEDSGLVGDGPDGERFFEDDGSTPSAAIRDLLDFLLKVEQNRAATASACAALQAADMLEPWPIVLKAPDGEARLDGLFRIREARLPALDDAAFLALRRTDALAVAYAQLLSMDNFGLLVRVASLRAQRPAEGKPQVQLGQDLDLSFLETGGTLKLG